MESWYDASRFAANPAENYQEYFVPVIGRPVAGRLIEAVELLPGEEVLDVACGTGVAARLAREAVGAEGGVTGVDVNPGMLAVARASTPAEMRVDWVESPAEDMPFDEDAFDAVLCGMGLQFFENREAGLREMRRVLSPAGRVVFNVPGPIPPPFQLFERGLARHVSPEVAGFAAVVFALHDEREIRELVRRAGFENARVTSHVETLTVPAPKEFLWQYIHSTPLAAALAEAGEERQAALEREVCEGWREFAENGGMRFDVRMTTVVARG